MPHKRKEWLDIILVSRGIFASREKAKSFILAGSVRVNEAVVDKPGTRVDIDANISVAEKPRYVSRGGEKLEYTLDAFEISPAGMRALDVGASTGGFTHCLLLGDAACVYALDVGYGQLDFSLRNDPRVTVLEKTNIRYVTPADFPHKFDLITVDVSFISLRLVLPVVKGLLAPSGRIVALVKPQFEAGRDKVGKGGVVRDRSVREDVLFGIIGFCEEIGLAVLNAVRSPLRGPKGNIEFFLFLSEMPEGSAVSSVEADKIREIAGG
ncbi:MAG: TlyA family RNA methyltransferase [bacterium]